MDRAMKCPDCGFENLSGAEDCESCSAPLASFATPQPKRGLSEKILSGTIADLSPRPAISVSVEETLPKVVELMRLHKMGCVLVLRGREVLGLMTERDLLYMAAGQAKGWENKEVKDIMHEDPVYVKSHHPVSFAFHHMSVGGYRHLPVQMEDGSFAMVSSRDLLRYLTQ